MNEPRKRRRWGIAVAAAVTATAATAGVMIATNTGKDTAVAAREAKAPATTEITRTDLVRSKTVDGQLDYAQRRAVKSPVEGTITKAADVGSTVALGQRLYERDARPVVLLYGSTPMFRTMKTDDRGPDVLQLERNLRDLGFGSGLFVDIRFDAATKAAVKAWQKSLGVIEANGEVGKGDVVFQRGPVRVVSADAALADGIAPDKTVLTVASTKPVVRASLDEADRALAAKDTKAEISLPSGGTRHGRVSGTVVPESTGDAEGGAGGGSPKDSGVEVEITFDGGGELKEKDRQGTLSVKFVSESRKDVLTVPVEALVALREGGYGLDLVEGGRKRTVQVEAGLSADGRIEVSGAGLREGMKVGTAEQ
ncbi:peptidoglycan-binding protein [Streptomyces platensis]|uniref:peptidoglycan-binding protein n=1 Tax=Streptomyces platensis TaxID=58346 RepID=UPI001F1F0B1A|nr:peptidoglycan-binding protein [Streptomyces platensis]